jgi:hypothetical protein
VIDKISGVLFQHLVSRCDFLKFLLFCCDHCHTHCLTSSVICAASKDECYNFDRSRLACSSFWSFLLTGTANNQELKIWSSQDWSCLQTITLLPPLDVASHFDVSSPTPAALKPYVKVAVDLSASYMVLSDISRKVCILTLL